MSKTDIPCLILCGGTSVRFAQGDKALAQLHGKSVLQHVIDRITPQCGEIHINAPVNVGFETYGLTLRPDIPGERKGPVAGILAAMEWGAEAGHARVLTCSNDTPFIPTDWAERLQHGDEEKIVVPVYAGRAHFVCALWPTEMQGQMSEYLDKGGRSVHGFVHAQPIENIEFMDENDVDPFFNINRIEDLQAAEHILQEISRQ